MVDEIQVFESKVVFLTSVSSLPTPDLYRLRTCCWTELKRFLDEEAAHAEDGDGG